MATNDYKWTPKRSANGMYEYEGSNGLKLLLVPKPGLSVTTCNVTYHVGSRNEGLGLTGATHYLEHGQFKGSKNFKGDKGMWYLETLGGELNATTYLDRTNFFEVIETKFIEECIKREADRMESPLLTPESLKSEMSVVRNEYERGENSAFQLSHKRLFATAYLAHPYHHSTIGWKSDIENVTAKSLKDFHDKYYTPSNATYTFVGNFDPELIKDQVGKYFAHIPPGDPIDKMYTVEPEQTGTRRVTVKRESRSSILGLGFKGPHGLHKDAIVLSVLGHILTSGPEATMASLKHKGIVHDVIASWERMKDPFLFVLWCTTNYPTEEAVKNAETQVLQKISNFQKPTKEAVDLAIKALDFQWKASMEGTKNLAMAINESISRGDAFDVWNRFSILHEITPDDVIRVAQQYFDTDKLSIVSFLPGKVRPKSYMKMDYKTPSYDIAPKQLEAPSDSTLNFKKQSSEDNGITFTKYENTNNVHILVSMEAQESKYTPKEYVARMILSKMMMKGAFVNSSSCPEKAISKFLQENGIRREFSHSPNGVILQLVIPKDNTKIVNKMVKLMKAEIESPMLELTSFTYTKNRTLAEINGIIDDVNRNASSGLYRALFNKGDANYRHDARELSVALKSLSIHDVKKEHENLNKNALTKLTIVGPSLIRTCSLKTSPQVIKFKRNIRTDAPMIQRIQIPGKSSCTVNMGMIVKPTIDLVVAAGILGNGFSGRLMKYVRDKKGLTYGIGSKMKRENGAGILKVVATFAPSLLEEGMKSTTEVLDKWFDASTITENEVKIQKQILLGSRTVHFDKPAQIAGTVHNAAVRGLGIKYIDDFTKKVNAVTLRSVQAAIQGLDRNNLKTVIAGTFH